MASVIDLYETSAAAVTSAYAGAGAGGYRKHCGSFDYDVSARSSTGCHRVRTHVSSAGTYSRT